MKQKKGVYENGLTFFKVTRSGTFLLMRNQAIFIVIYHSCRALLP